MLFELHSHSWYSKDRFASRGFCSPVELVKVAQKIGLSGIAVTDHDSFKAWSTLKDIKLDNFTIIPGEEISTRQGHLIALGINEEIRPAQTFMETLDQIHAQGGIAVAPHPFDLNEIGIAERAQHADAVEVFNSMNLDRFSNARARAFAQRYGKSMVSGSDAHANYMVGRGVTIVPSDFSVDSALKAIKSGKTKAVGNYHPVMEMANWYVDRLSSDEEAAKAHMIHNHSLFKQGLLKTIMSHRSRKGILSRSLFYTLPYVVTASSAAKSLFVNGPECLI